ncbi:putative ABC transport system ATP-binding protein [Tahibacter aquaticus]|uniref:Putative ABC transport system ATP-binding protein n=1 Tax=Tahibacter aquaticus TaxID=520092 RepID=A0A4R6YSI3_9GAMM|nr:ABC transporter ATP-binding protein [Tahibacter aquaticus]TDR41209.1 putative ABC transport system ATP-binding protein [Tahibacter aquaticus]
MNRVLTLADVGVTYGRGATAFAALQGINLDIASGEMTLLLGPSGSGKTSLLQVMGCLLRASCGSVQLFGQALARDVGAEAMAALRLAHIGFVFQHYNLFPTLKAWENVAVALDIKQVPRAQQREQALALLARLGLADRAGHYPSELSGGQKQRVAIARALAGAPRILLADEPTAALDGKTGQGVAAALHELAHREGVAVVVVSHDPRVEPFGDRVLHLEDGRLVDDSRPSRSSA